MPIMKTQAMIDSKFNNKIALINENNTILTDKNIYTIVVCS